MKKVSLSFLALVFLATSCGTKEESKTERVFDVNVNLENDFINIENTKKQYNAHSGDYYSGVDSITVYGAGYVKKIDDTLKGYNLNVCISAWVRELYAPCEGGIAVSLNGAGGTKDWKVLQPNADTFKPNEWNQILDTIKYTSSLVNESNEIKIFSMKQNGSDAFDVDDLRIKYIFYK